MNKDNNRRYIEEIIPICLGIIAFYFVIGVEVLDPRNISWLSGDAVTHFLGWQFFRDSPWLLPLGLNPNYGIEISNSLVYSDSIPLLAFLLKPFSRILPDKFQYVGLWLLICFTLQAWFGWKLIGLISKVTSIRFFATGLLVFSPPMLWRLFCDHYSLVAHFPIIYALYLAFQRKYKAHVVPWAFLLVSCAWIHAYLLMMVVCIWFADVLSSAIRSPRDYKKLLLQSAATLTVVIASCWLAGYFVVDDYNSEGGYGYYRMNLLSLFDPNAWSYVIKDLPNASGDYEGYNYFGLGIIVTIAFSAPAIILNIKTLFKKLHEMCNLAIVLIILSLFSITNKIGIGEYNLEYSIPKNLTVIANTFRSSGRLFWPCFYVLVFIFIYFMVKYFNKTVAIILLFFSMVIQVADTRAGWLPVKNKIAQNTNSDWEDILKNDFWTTAASAYKKVRLVCPVNKHEYYKIFANYAYQNKLATDAVYLARIDKNKIIALRNKCQEAIKKGKYEQDSLYIIDKNEIVNVYSRINLKNDLLTEVDNFYILAPGWKNCEQCPQISSDIDLNKYLPTIEAGERIDFSADGKGEKLLLDGWSSPESWGTWSDGYEANIIIPVTDIDKDILSVEIEAFTPNENQSKTVMVEINGEQLFSKKYILKKRSLININLSKEILKKSIDHGFIIVNFKFINPERPSDYGINDDQRQLAIGLIAMMLL